MQISEAQLRRIKILKRDVKLSKPTEGCKACYNALAGNGMGSELNEKARTSLKKLADKVKRANGKVLVVSGSNNVAEQVVVNAINEMLGSYGSTITFDRASNQRQGIDKNMVDLISLLLGNWTIISSILWSISMLNFVVLFLP